MDDDDALNRFLAGAASEALHDYANKLGPEILKHSLGSGIRVECSRRVDADWETIEIVVVDTIEFRISGPHPPDPTKSAGSDRLKFTLLADIPPALRATRVAAKAEATRTNAQVTIELSGTALAVRRSGGMAFSAHTGDYGAVWYFLDPENRPANNPGVTVEFRAFLLATGGLDAAEKHFRDCMIAFGIAYTEDILRVSRVDVAVDILAPWFEPNRNALVVPPGQMCENSPVWMKQKPIAPVRV